MSFFDILSLLGGLAMFLYGMRLMGDSLKENSSGTLKKVMEKVTDNAFKAFGLGIAVTALIQSSTATIVITSGLVGAGILTLRQSLGIIIGANVGTTVTGQIIRLLDLNAEGGTSFLRLFQPSTLAPLALIIGIVLIMTKLFRNSRSIGSIAVGFGILFSGLLNMTSAVAALQKSGVVEQLFSSLGSNPFLGYLIGAGVAFALQSSSATIGILQAFSASGLLTFNAIYSVIVGIYLGDCVTTAIVCSIGANREAKRVGIVNILFNLSETVLVLAVITLIHRIGLLDGLWNATVNSGMIANTNTIFNLACAVCLFPMLRVYEKLSDRIVRKEKEATDPHSELIKALNPVFYTTPALALKSCYDVLLTMFTIARENLERAQGQISEFSEPARDRITAVERQVDRLTDNLSRYLVEMLPHLKSEAHIAILNQYYKVSTEFENLGDRAVNISDIATKLSDNHTGFSETFKKELAVLQGLIQDVLDDAEKAFEERSEPAAAAIEPKVHVVNDLINRMTQNHFTRMSAGECSYLADAVFSNLMAEYKRIAGICSNTGMATLVRIHPELASKEHMFLETLDKNGDARYRNILEQTHTRYFSLLDQVETGQEG
ncbi:MAG: Na/Pi cotransporter family protein [Clostridia bacterium]|nr:Na/Pi cotransporter family protein [Clostridia bacterium]